MLHLFATTQQHATWDKANLLLLQQKIPFNGDYALGTTFQNPRISLSLTSSSELNILQRASSARTRNRPDTGSESAVIVSS
jgi:hypothetical protein